MARNFKFRNYLSDLPNKKKQQEAMNFVKKYKPLLSEGKYDQFDLDEKIMTVKEALSMKTNEALTSRDAAVLVTTVIEGALQQAAEPMYLASELFDTVQVDNNNRIVFPAIGQLRAQEIAEGQSYPQDQLDIVLREGATEVDVTKKGVMIPITHEMIDDSQWEIIGAHIEAAGRAMARLKEEIIFKMMTRYGNTVFDNSIRADRPEAGTTGRDEYGNFNNTLSVEDVFDIVIALMNNEYNPTDVLIHPLTWSVFAKNGLVQIFDNPALSGQDEIGEISQEASAGRLPVNLNIMSSPFIPFDRQNKQFDMYCIDRSSVGVIIQREEMTTDEFDDPYKDIRNLKVKERYGVGVLDEGKAVTVAKNVALDTSYPKPNLVRTISANEYENQEE